MGNRLYVDVHVLQTVPPSNLNRDDAGTPKQAIYGGVRRARVSSQAWKRATRLAFAEQLQMPAEQLGIRSKRIGRQLADRIGSRTGLGGEPARRLANAVIGTLSLAENKRKGEESAYLLFYGHAQLDRLADLVSNQAVELADLPDDALGKVVAEFDVQGLLTNGHPIDVALFGRMVADLTALNVDAATQVAHAISTHPVEIEFDYYTAVDDAKDRATEDAGAGMIGTVEFTSATLYRFATVGMHQLVTNLDGHTNAAVDALAAFLNGFVYSMPTGHQNAFAHRTLPALVSVVVREDQPVNLVSAFENPVRERGGIVRASAQRLDRELHNAAANWAIAPVLISSQYDPDSVGDLPTLGAPQPFPTVVAAVRESVTSRLSVGDPR